MRYAKIDVCTTSEKTSFGAVVLFYVKSGTGCRLKLHKNVSKHSLRRVQAALNKMARNLECCIQTTVDEIDTRISAHIGVFDFLIKLPKEREGTILCTGREICEKYAELVGTTHNVYTPYGETAYWSAALWNGKVHLGKKDGRITTSYYPDKELVLVPIR